ncbi:MAG TPA: hypothetical protein VFZ52_25085 [Chryseolinea sp.]
MFKKKSHETRILDFMYEHTTAFYTVDGLQKSLPDIDTLVISQHVEDLEKNGIIESRKVWKPTTETSKANKNHQENDKGYKLTKDGLRFVKSGRDKKFKGRIKIASITVVTLLIPILMGTEYFEILLGGEPVKPYNQIKSVPMATDTITTKFQPIKSE